MNRIIALLLLLFMFLSLSACGTTSIEPMDQSLNEVTPNVETSKYTADEQAAMDYFIILNEAVKADTTGTYSNINYGTDAYAAMVKIENLYKSNKNNYIIKQIYYYTEVISCISTASILSESKYYDQGLVYAKQIDLSYEGPFADEIIGLAKKYVTESNSVSEKNALTMSASEKEEVIKFINERYDYYDKINGGYAGDKYTEIIWKETAEKFGITTTDVDMIWWELS